MGTFKVGILGGFSGKVGTVIGGCWKGIDYMRSRAASISNPRTPAQVEQRAKMSTVVKFLQPLTSFLRIGFKSAAIKMSAFNAATKYNLANAITGVFPNLEIDFTKARVSQGNFPGALNPATLAAIAGAIEFTWEDNSWETDAAATDEAVLVVYNPAKEAVVSVVGGIGRSVGTQTIILPNAYTGDEVHCYIAFTNANQSVISNSQYISGIVVS